LFCFVGTNIDKIVEVYVLDGSGKWEVGSGKLHAIFGSFPLPTPNFPDEPIRF